MTPDHDSDYLVMASTLPLNQYRQVPSFLQGTLTIRRQLARAEGLIGYALDAKLFSKTFWTVSAWESQDALNAFARTSPHDVIVKRTRPHMADSVFVTWTKKGSGIPISWQEAHEHVAEHLRRK